MIANKRKQLMCSNADGCGDWNCNPMKKIREATRSVASMMMSCVRPKCCWSVMAVPLGNGAKCHVIRCGAKR
jgi:hypothetical protein